MVYLSYKEGTFKTKRPSRGRSVPPKSTASSSGMQPTLTETPYGDTGGEGTKRKPGRPLGSINKPKL